MIKKASLLSLAVIAGAAGAFAQKGAPQGYKKLPSGLYYKSIKDVPGNTPKMGDVLEVNFIFRAGDSLITDTRQTGQPAKFPLAAPTFNGDMMEGFTMLSPGDVMSFKVPVDSLPKNPQQPMPDFLVKAGMLDYEVELVSVMTQEQVQAQQAKMQAEQQAKMEEMKAKETAQVPIDAKLLESYLAKRGIKATKTPSGMYYSVSKMGTGIKPKAGDEVTMNYTGKLTNDTLFDSNILPKFNHVQPFTFRLGQGQVIKGWDEGIALMPKGTKGTLYIPSGMAYGAAGRPPVIPENSILVFDVEVVDVKNDESTILDYMKSHKHTGAKKTASGMYYRITKQGTGALPKPGDMVSMKYTGKLTNDTLFDSNIEPRFGHTDPFNFTLGQGQVIKGWDEGIALLPVGTKATLYLPSELAYGAASPSPAIPANSVMVFDVEVLEIMKK